MTLIQAPVFLPSCSLTDVGCLAGEAAGGAFTAIVNMLGKGVVAMTKFLSTFWLNVPSPQVATGSGSSWAMDSKIAELQGWMGPVTATIALCSFAVALARMAWAGDFREGRGAVRQVAVVAAGSLVVAAITQVIITAGDAFSPWVIAQASGGDPSTGLNTLIAAGLSSGTANTQAGLWFILFILMALGALVQCIFMVIRGPVLWLLMVFVPPTAAGSASEEGWSRFKRLTMVLIAFALYKPVAAMVYAAGLLLMTRSGSASDPSNSIQSAVYGLAIMVLAALALPALIKFLVPLAAVGSSSAFSGGAAVGAIAGGAAIVATLGAGGGAGAAVAGGAGPQPSPPGPNGPNGDPGGSGGPDGGPGGAPDALPAGGGQSDGGNRGVSLRDAADLGRGASRFMRDAEPDEPAA